MIRILDSNLEDMGHLRVKRRKNDRSRNFSLHVSLLQAKVTMITGAKTKGRLLWESGRNAEMCSNWHLELHVEQGSQIRPGGQMLAANFSN